MNEMRELDILLHGGKKDLGQGEFEGKGPGWQSGIFKEHARGPGWFETSEQGEVKLE